MSYDLKSMLSDFKDGKISADEVLLKFREKPFDDLDFAKVDLHRKARQGTAEVIYGAGKTAEQIIGIAGSMLKNGQQEIMITRLDRDKNDLIEREIELSYYETAKIGYIGKIPEPDGIGTVLVLCAGTSDIPVAEEAAVTAEILGNKVNRIYDVGVSGLHRLLSRLDDIMSASVIIAVAGMEGALASVVGGLSDKPVIAVPTSVGYGASFEGITALLSMLNSCSAGVTVVNIDNGFGAGYTANMINHIGG